MIVAGRRYMFTLFEASPVFEYANMGSLRMMFYEVPLSTAAIHWCFHSWNQQHSANCPVKNTAV